MSDLSNIGSDTAAGASVGGPWGAAIGAGLGLLQSIGGDNAYQANMALQAAKQRYSGMTGQKPGANPTPPNTLGNVVGLGAAGAQLGQGLTTDKQEGKAFDSGNYAAAAELAAANEAGMNGLAGSGGLGGGPAAMAQMGAAWPGGPLAAPAAASPYSAWLRMGNQ